jgi:hypothetical protein
MGGTPAPSIPSWRRRSISNLLLHGQTQSVSGRLPKRVRKHCHRCRLRRGLVSYSNRLRVSGWVAGAESSKARLPHASRGFEDSAPATRQPNSIRRNVNQDRATASDRRSPVSSRRRGDLRSAGVARSPELAITGSQEGFVNDGWWSGRNARTTRTVWHRRFWPCGPGLKGGSRRTAPET